MPRSMSRRSRSGVLGVRLEGGPPDRRAADPVGAWTDRSVRG